MQNLKRIHSMDEIRGLCVVCMVVYHALFTVGYLFNIKEAVDLFLFFSVAEPFFAAAFIIISGISSQLSKNNLKRSLYLFLIAIAVSAVTVFIVPNAIIYFGILHFLAVSIFLFSFLKKPFNKIPFTLGVIICIVLFLVTFSLPDKQLIGIDGLISYKLPPAMFQNNNFLIFGFVSNSFSSSDYFPLIPWIFAFFLGTFLGRYAQKERFPKFLYKSRVKPLSYIGRHALIIYVVHQPIIYGICYAVSFFANK